MGARVASLEVQIGANVSGFQSAAGQVRSGLNNIANDAKAAAGAIGGTSAKIEQFNTRARALENAYATGTISAREYTRQGQALAWSMMSTGEKFDVVRQRVQSFTANMAGASAIVGLMGKQAYNFARSGAEIDYTAQRFDRLARSVGSTGDVFMNDLRVATRGTVSDFDLLKQGSDLLQLGLAGSKEEAIRLSRVMTALGMDTGELTLALANQSKRRLDQLGLSLSKFNEIESRLKGAGMTKEAAFKEAFMQTAEQTILTTGNRADSGMGDMLRFEAEMSNVWNEMKQMFVQSTPMMFGNQSIASTMGQVANTVRELRRLVSGETRWNYTGWNSDTNQFGFDVTSRAANVGQLAQAQWTRNNTQVFAPNATPSAASFGPQDVGQLALAQGTQNSTQFFAPGATPPSAESFMYEDAAARNARLRPGGAGGGGDGAVQTPVDYAALLSGGLDAAKALSQFNDKTLELNTALREENEELEMLTQKYGANSQKVEEQQQKIANLRAGITDLRSEMTNATEQMGLEMLKTAGATEEQQLEYARASGMMSQDAYETVNALQKLSDAAATGKIGASEYASAVSQLNSWVSQMDGLQVDTYIDVWIREHGGGGLPIVSARPGVCFVAGTQITMADGSHKPIEQVQIGDAVLSYVTDERAYVDGKVTQLFRHDTDEYLDIDGLLVTPEHPFWVVGRGWVKAGDVRKGDLFLCDNHDFKEVEIIIRLRANTVVYNLEVDEVHTYFAGGVLVHNKRVAEAWTGGPLSGDGFTVVGDAPGGSWTPYTEVIYNGHVFNASEARALRDAGLLGDAVHMAGGSAGERPGSGNRGGRREGGARERPGRTNRNARTPITTISASPDAQVSESESDAAASSAAAQTANTAAAMVVSTQEATQASMQDQTQQQVAATHESQAAIVEKLDELGRILKKQPDKNDMYALFHSGQQTNI